MRIIEKSVRTENPCLHIHIQSECTITRFSSLTRISSSENLEGPSTIFPLKSDPLPGERGRKKREGGSREGGIGTMWRDKGKVD
jgi:hypothetical protein